MRNLVVCCDGTWNTPEQREEGVPVPTNVVRLYNAVAERDGAGAEQLRYYHPGVGSEGNWWERLAGGSAGVGLTRNVLSAYRWLGSAYRDDPDGGDHLFLYGFSRGAYTVRSLAGMIGQCGLLDLTGLDDGEVWRRVERAFKQGYRKGRDAAAWADAGWRFHGGGPGTTFPIHFIGVWDTVGALGIPDDLTLLNLLDDPKKYAFHATDLGDGVAHARHALALDEVRASFSPTLWTEVAADRDVRQVWFPGVHADVGGGYPETGLSDCALQWMVEESNGLGLGFRPDMVAQLRPDPRGVLHDSRTGLFRMLRSQPRSCPHIDAGGGAALSTAAVERQVNPPIAQAPYRPTRRLRPGEEVEVSIYAAQPWNETGLYLEAGGLYEFTATGQWVDRTIKCSPDGSTIGRFKIGELAHLAGSLWGQVEDAFKRMTKNEQADFRGTKRVESLPWFALVGAVANGGNPGADGTPAPHELIPIKGGGSHTPERSGYLYCFANDAWHFYDNNRGSVRLTVRRRS